MNIKETKDWLSRVKTTSWHFRLVTSAHVSVPKKACIYYWICIPNALLVAAATYAGMAIVVVVSWFLGFTPNFDARGKEESFFPYKTKRDGTRKWCAPWELVAIALATWGVTRILDLVMAHPREVVVLSFWICLITLVAVLCLLIAWALAYSIIEGAKQSSGSLKKFWDWVCPELQVEKVQTNEHTPELGGTE